MCLKRDDCILETEIGVVDGSLERQLGALERVLRSRLQKCTDSVSADRGR
jgi:type III secretion protein L